MKYFDLHLLGIIGLVLVLSIILASDAFFGATQNAGQWEAILALLLLLFPQGRIVTRMGDLKKMGHSGWSRLTYLIISEAMVLLAVITYTLVNAR